MERISFPKSDVTMKSSIEIEMAPEQWADSLYIPKRVKPKQKRLLLLLVYAQQPLSRICLAQCFPLSENLNKVTASCSLDVEEGRF